MKAEYVNKKYGLSMKALKRVRTVYGSIDEFCYRYIEALVGAEDMKLNDDMNEGMVNHFDLTNPYMTGDNSGYVQLLTYVFNVKPGFITYEPIDDIVKQVMSCILCSEEIEVLNAYYNLDRKNVSLQDVCKKLEINGRAVDKIRKKSLKKLATNVKNTKLQLLEKSIEDSSFAADIFREILEAEDVFYSEKIEGISEKKLKLAYRIFEKSILSVDYSSDNGYIERFFVLKNRINKSALNSSEKNKLKELLNNKKIDISKNCKDEIIDCFRKEIQNISQNSNCSCDEIVKRIRNSGLNENDMNGLILELQKIKPKKEEKQDDFRRRILAKIGFPHLNLKVEEMEISKKAKEAMCKAGFYCVEDIILFSKQELLRFGNILRCYTMEVMAELERIGFDISDNSKLSIEEYNQDKIGEDNYSCIAHEIKESNYEDYFKSSLVTVVLRKTIQALKAEYELLDSSITTYKDVIKTHERCMKDNMNIVVYDRKLNEAEAKKEAINSKLKILEK